MLLAVESEPELDQISLAGMVAVDRSNAARLCAGGRVNLRVETGDGHDGIGTIICLGLLVRGKRGVAATLS